MIKDPLRHTLVGLATAFAVLVHASAEAQDPRDVFIGALGEFSLGLRGESGDEGVRLRAALERMRRAVEAWDERIRISESAMQADRKGADAQGAVRLHVALGAVYLDRGRHADALRELAAAAALDPTRADIPQFQALAPPSPSATARLADARPASGGGSSAPADHLAKAAALDPRNPVLSYEYARSLSASGRRDEAVKELERFLALQPLSLQPSPAPSAPFLRAGLVQESPGVEPFFPPARYASGFALLQGGDYAGAVRQFAEAFAADPLAAAPGAETGAVTRAAAALRDGVLETAIQQLTLATTLEPDRSEPYRLLGQAYVLDDQHDKAIQALTRAVTLNPADERTHLALAAAFVRNNQLAEAAQHLQQTLKAVPESGQAQYELGLVYQRDGKYPEALEAFEKSLRFQPLLGANSVYQTIGALRRSQQDFDAARDAFTKRIDLIPNDAAAHRELGDVHLQQGNHTEARAEFTVALMLDPTNIEAQAATAQLHLRDGRYQDAADAATRVLGIDPDHREARYALATSLIRLGRAEDGKRELDIFQRQQTENAAARARLFELEGMRREAAISAAGGDHENAIALLRKVVDADPAIAGSLLDLGFALIDGSRHADAIPYLLKAVELGAHYEVHRHLAAAYAAIGQAAESRQQRALYEQLKRDAFRQSGVSR
jgi:tetratricopeptide (TPR) repeat protein